jgi:hypothetical protein
MKYANNERGIALVLALIVSLIVLATVSALVYLVTQGTAGSGFQKRYITSLEAAKGSAKISCAEVISNLIGSNDASALGSSASSLASQYDKLDLAFNGTASCLLDKLLRTQMTGSTNNWSNCGPSNWSLDPTESPDMTFTLSGVKEDFGVSVKIVDATHGNTDRGGRDLIGWGVVEGDVPVPPKHNPFVYRMEINSTSTSSSSGGSVGGAKLSVICTY